MSLYVREFLLEFVWTTSTSQMENVLPGAGEHLDVPLCEKDFIRNCMDHQCITNGKCSPRVGCMCCPALWGHLDPPLIIFSSYDLIPDLILQSLNPPSHLWCTDISKWTTYHVVSYSILHFLHIKSVSLRCLLRVPVVFVPYLDIITSHCFEYEKILELRCHNDLRLLNQGQG